MMEGVTILYFNVYTNIIHNFGAVANVYTGAEF